MTNNLNTNISKTICKGSLTGNLSSVVVNLAMDLITVIIPNPLFNISKKESVAE